MNLYGSGSQEVLFMSIVKQGKKKRAEFSLPALHFIVADDWIDKLGESFTVWLKLHTFVDRTDMQREYDRVPMSLEKLYDKLKVSKSKFYRLIKPLWEYGLIDIIEYEASERKAQKPKNIIVYEYPFHIIEKKYSELEKLRDWKTDYDSTSKVAGQTGGRPKKIDTAASNEPESETVENDELDGFKNETVEKKDLDGFKNETVDGFKNETVTVSEIKPNNVSNNSIKDSNSHNKDSNINSSSFKNETRKGKEEDELNNIFFDYLRDFCFENNFCNSDYQFKQIVERLRNKDVNKFTAMQVQMAYNKTLDQIYNQNVDQPHLYFASVLENEIVNDRLYKIKDYEVQKQKKESAERASKIPFFNWLEERS